MLGDKNGLIPFPESPRNAFCNNGILLKIPLLSKPNFNTDFSIKHLNSIIYVQSIAFYVAELLGYAINKIGRFYRLKKIVISIKLKNYKI